MESFGVYQSVLNNTKKFQLNKGNDFQKWPLWSFTYKMQSLWKQIIVKFGNNTATVCLKPFLTHVAAAGWPSLKRQMLFLFRHFVAAWENQAGSNCCVLKEEKIKKMANSQYALQLYCAVQKLPSLSINLLLKILKVILVKDQDSANFSSILKMTNL